MVADWVMMEPGESIKRENENNKDKGDHFSPDNSFRKIMGQLKANHPSEIALGQDDEIIQREANPNPPDGMVSAQKEIYIDIDLIRPPDFEEYEEHLPKKSRNLFRHVFSQDFPRNSLLHRAQS
ncbi:uncharacterized protein TRUGW13939_06215 [Talaromyces rugulosus]|uniref:Uncharacterized protein n=1 Tax=Talaromyces rugulosus TaxID=121627 RepID=A0A7H8QY83_TALRU|nr:uncharacterized protein TRUGW13939_06215 [Talaromyces rugulosus]QKX59084.1 hypothetical protein TRUGW13939_06215 [Talaromyces rugulosus]